MVTEVEQKIFEELLTDRSENLLHISIKDFIKDRCLKTLYDEYDNVINNPNCTESDALEYILLFSAFGNWLAAMLGCTMDEYYMATDVFLEIVGLIDHDGDSNDE